MTTPITETQREAIINWANAYCEKGPLRSVSLTEKADYFLKYEAALTASEQSLAEANQRITTLKKALREAPHAVPTTWLDPLLTGPDRVLTNESGNYNAKEIEELLRRLKARLQEKVDAALQQQEQEAQG